MIRWLVLLLIGTFASPATAAPADSLLTLIPSDTAVCVVARDTRGTVHRLTKSPFAQWLTESRFVDPFLPPAERAKLQAVSQVLTEKLGSTPQQLLDDVLGDAIVLAYRPGVGGKSSDESGVILLHARDPQRLATVLDRLNAHQRETGELKSVTDRGKYLQRIRADGGKEYVYRDGQLLAFSGQETVLLEVIDRRTNKPKTLSPAGDSIRHMGLADAACVLWLNPHVLSADLIAKRDAPTTPAKEKAALVQVAKVWGACDGLALAVRAGERLEVSLTAEVAPARLPPELKPLLDRPAGSSAWGAVPADALFAIGSRLDLPSLVTAAESFLPQGESVSAELAVSLGPLFGKGNVPTVLAGIGPEWIAWTEYPKSGIFPDWTIAVRLAPTVSKPILQALDLGASLIRLAYNRDHTDTLDLRDETRDGRTVKSLVGGLPQQPSYGLGDGFLVVASSPERVFKFKAPPDVKNAPIARLNVARLRQYLQERSGELSIWMAAQNGRPAAELARELDGLAYLMQAITRLELRHTTSDGVIRLTLEVEPVKPLQ